MNRYTWSAPRFVYRVRDSIPHSVRAFAVCTCMYGAVPYQARKVAACNLPQYGRREADPSIISAGQFPPARPEQDSPHWRVNASPPRLILALDSPRLLPDLSAFFPSFGGLFLFSVFRYSHHLAETTAHWWANCSSSLLETSPRVASHPISLSSYPHDAIVYAVQHEPSLTTTTTILGEYPDGFHRSRVRCISLPPCIRQVPAILTGGTWLRPTTHSVRRGDCWVYCKYSTPSFLIVPNHPAQFPTWDGLIDSQKWPPLLQQTSPEGIWPIPSTAGVRSRVRS